MERSLTSEQTVTQMQTETVVETDVTDSASQVSLVLSQLLRHYFYSIMKFTVVMLQFFFTKR